jgi:hypothetical protein
LRASRLHSAWSLLAVFACVSFCAAQDASPADSSLLERAYTSHFFGFRYDISPSWTAQTEAAKRQFSELRRLRVNPNPDAPDSDLDPSGKQIFFNLLTLTRPIPVSGGRPSRAVIAVLAEQLPSTGDLPLARENLHQLTALLAKFHYLPMRDVEPVQIGGRPFIRQDLKRTGSALPYQTLIYSVVRGYSLGIVLIAPNPHILEGMVNGLSKLQFLRPPEP